MKQSVNRIRRAVRDRQPLIHCITNPISINQCANGLLAIGARPVMAEHPKEAAEITRTAQGLLLNLGNITDARMESMELAAAAAKEKGIPIVLDAVGVGCSSLRRAYAQNLLGRVTPTVIKGNDSEILALHTGAYRCSGVDAEAALDSFAAEAAALSLARKHNAILLASGKRDIVTDGKRLFRIQNGTAQLSRVTGTGCLQGALCAAYLCAEQTVDAVVTGCGVLGICGELARTDRGSGTFLLKLMDALSTLTDAQIEKNLKLEEQTIAET